MSGHNGQRSSLLTLTHVQDVQCDDVRGGPAQLVGRLHPDLVRGEEVEVSGDAAGVRLHVGVILTLLLFPVPPENRKKNTSFYPGTLH